MWRPVVGYEGYYEVSNLGRIRTVEHKVYNPHVLGDGMYRTVPSIIRKQQGQKGYMHVTLAINKHKKRLKVHRIVAEAFIGPAPSPEHQVNHIDGNKANNRVDNLEWCTPDQNTKHAIQTGLRGPMTEDTKQKIADASSERWLDNDYRKNQCARQKQAWIQHHDSRSKAIKDGISKSKSTRYLHNRPTGDDHH